MKKEGIKRTIYKNGVGYKLPNRRITIVDQTETIAMEFRIADKDSKPCSRHTRLKGKVNVTTLKLTRLGATILMMALADVLAKEGNTHE
jgi:hypothetical protein